MQPNGARRSPCHTPSGPRTAVKTADLNLNSSAAKSPLPTQEPPTLGEIASAWLRRCEADHADGELALSTIRLYRRLVAKRLIPALGDTPVAEISLADLRALRQQFAHMPSEANQLLRVTRRVLQAAIDTGLRPEGTTYAHRVRRLSERRTQNPTAPDEVWRLFRTCAEIRAGRLDLCHPTMAALFQVVAVTGARPSEIRTLRWSDLTWRRRFVEAELVEHKTSRDSDAKTLVFSAIARGVLLSLCPDAPADPVWVFPSHAKPGHPYRDITRAWRRVADDGDSSTGTCLRDFRSGLATNAAEANIPLEQIQEMLGHRSIATTRRYVTIPPRRVAAAQQAVSDSVFGLSTKGGRRG